jgi:nitrate reductase NapAB chaperone NapD
MTSGVDWSVSGLCLMVRPERMAEVERQLDELPWLEVHARDEPTGRLIVVQEHATVEEHRQGLRQLQAIPDVLTADLVVHHKGSPENGS